MVIGNYLHVTSHAYHTDQLSAKNTQKCIPPWIFKASTQFRWGGWFHKDRKPSHRKSVRLHCKKIGHFEKVCFSGLVHYVPLYCTRSEAIAGSSSASKVIDSRFAALILLVKKSRVSVFAQLLTLQRNSTNLEYRGLRTYIQSYRVAKMRG